MLKWVLKHTHFSPKPVSAIRKDFKGRISTDFQNSPYRLKAQTIILCTNFGQKIQHKTHLMAKNCCW